MNLKRFLLAFALLTFLSGFAFAAPSVIDVADISGEASFVSEAVIFGENTVVIDIGAKQSEKNVRFAEICGVQTEISENNNKLEIALADIDMLVEITEKTSRDAQSTVKTQYFYIDVDGKKIEKLNIMDNAMQSYDEKSVRLVGEMGIRFKAHVSSSAKSEKAQFVIDEYGYIITTAESLGEKNLTFDSPKYIKGIGYSREKNINIVYDATNDAYDVFTLVLKNIPVEHYNTRVVSKTYTKITVNGQRFVVYGEPMNGSVYEVASKSFIENCNNTDLAKIVFDYCKCVGVNSAAFRTSVVDYSTCGNLVNVTGSFENTENVGDKYNVYVAVYDDFGALKDVRKSETLTVVKGENSFEVQFELGDGQKHIEAYVLSENAELVGRDALINWQPSSREFYELLSSEAFSSTTDFSKRFDEDEDVSVIDAIALISNMHAMNKGGSVTDRTEPVPVIAYEMDDPDILIDLSERNSVNLNGINLNHATGSMENGILTFEPDDSFDLQVIINGIRFDSRSYNKITMRMKLEPINGAFVGNDSIQVFFKTNTFGTYTEATSVKYKYSNINEPYDWFEIEIDMGANDNWKDVITSLRIDPVNRNFKCCIDYIRIGEGGTKAPEEWYDMYLDYALDNGTVTLGQFLKKDYSRAITREEFMCMLMRTFSDSFFTTINSDLWGIPDVDKNDKFSEIFLEMYRSGITLGFEEGGKLSPKSPLKRSDAAAIINRIFVPDNRLRGNVNANWDGEDFVNDIEFRSAADFDKFDIITRVTKKSVVDGKAILECYTPRTEGSVTGDAYLVQNNTASIDADKFTKLKVRIRPRYAVENPTNSDKSYEVYFLPPDNPDAKLPDYHFWETVHDYYIDPAGWYVIELDMLHPEWKGIIRYFRFDVMNVLGTYEVDYIRFIKNDYYDLPTQKDLENAGYTRTELMPDGFKNGFYVGNPGDKAGIVPEERKVSFPESQGEPYWTFGPFWQGCEGYHIPSPLDPWENKVETSDVYTFADSYGVNTITYNPELDSITQRFNVTKVYNHKAHDPETYKWWPHQLFDTNTNFSSNVDLEKNSADADRMFVELDIRMLDYTPTTNVEGRNVCSYLAFFYLRPKHDLNQKIWFGLDLFTTTSSVADPVGLPASTSVKPGWTPDSAAHQFIYSIADAVVYGGIENSFNPSKGVALEGEEWKHIRLDVTPHIDRAVDWANRDNIFGYPVTKSDMCFNGVNIGYEITGNYDCTFEIKNFNMVAYNKPE